MITKFKIFESLKDNIEVGDYVIINVSYDYWPPLDKMKVDFINNNIGQIVDIVPYNTDVFYIKYENIPSKIKSHFYRDSFIANKNKIPNQMNILSISKNKEDLEFINTYNKYNL